MLLCSYFTAKYIKLFNKLLELFDMRYLLKISLKCMRTSPVLLLTHTQYMLEESMARFCECRFMIFIFLTIFLALTNIWLLIFLPFSMKS